MDFFLEFTKKLKELYIKPRSPQGSFLYSPYIHFDTSPLPRKVIDIENCPKFAKTCSKLYNIILNPKTYFGDTKYTFLPLLRVEEKKCKWSKKITKPREPDSKQRRRNKINPKIRPLTYCSNFEKILYIYYNLVLEDLYEKKIVELGIVDNVLAYRKIPKLQIGNEKPKNKCNIDFANESFQKITSLLKSNSKCTAIALDISGFFDNISHFTIKKEWSSLFSSGSRLPVEHFTIFEAITKFSFIRKDLLLEHIFKIKNKKQLKKAINGFTNIIQRGDLQNKNKYGSLRLFDVETTKNLEMIDIIKDCKRYYIKDKNGQLPKKKIFESHKKNYGIPQGLPISGVISNISFLSLDVGIKNICEQYNATYCRYCDDILITVPGKCSMELKNKVVELIEFEKRSLAKEGLIKNLLSSLELIEEPFLAINNKKTEIVEFTKINNRIYTHELNQNKINKPLIYLGFTFDGKNIRLKSAGINKRRTKIKYQIKRIEKIFKKSNKTIPKVKINKHLSSNGFVSYANRASSIDEKIKKQLQNLKFIKN